MLSMSCVIINYNSTHIQITWNNFNRKAFKFWWCGFLWILFCVGWIYVSGAEGGAIMFIWCPHKNEYESMLIIIGPNLLEKELLKPSWCDISWEYRQYLVDRNTHHIDLSVFCYVDIELFVILLFFVKLFSLSKMKKYIFRKLPYIDMSIILQSMVIKNSQMASLPII